VTQTRFLKVVSIALCILLGGCEVEGMQSVLEPQGPEAERIATLFWILIAASSTIVVTVVLLTAAALTGGNWRRWLARETTVVIGGIVLPVAALSTLIAFGFLLTRANAIAPGEEKLRISVIGEQWWWRIGYVTADGQRVQTANELRMPTHVPVAIELTTADVIHSFWVPKLAGKLDMIPGRRTLLHLEASEPGVSRGQCAEYCGGAHAFMSFHVVAMEEEAFKKWLSHQNAPAIPPANPLQSRGQELFLAAGCGGCHTIRGTSAKGVIGPDLTHVGTRMSLAAATLPNDATAFAHWMENNQQIKPENRMPPFRLFTAAELAALAGYLASLK
jgi:cytochrome c oxidase subunit 2